MSKLGVMNEIAKFFRGRSGPKSLLLAYARFGKDAVNKYFKERQPSYNLKIDNKNLGGEMKKTAQQKSLAASMEAGAKRQFKQTKKKTAQKKRNTPISDVDKKPRPKPSPFKPTPFKNGGMANRRAGIAKRGFNNFKGIF
tara:strand:- start:167 stop:586 length:420 start_codon:yes stop_codon:yes gene_type:complete